MSNHYAGHQKPIYCKSTAMEKLKNFKNNFFIKKGCPSFLHIYFNIYTYHYELKCIYFL